MSNCRLSSRVLAFIMAIFTFTALAFGQHDLVIKAGSQFTGNGTYNVTGNITNAGVASSKVIHGKVNLTGAAQSIGTAANGTIGFDTLIVQGTGNKSSLVADSVLTLLDNNAGSTINFSNGANRLYLMGSITKTGVTSAPYTFNTSGSSVVYGQTSGSPAIYGTTYDTLRIATTVATSLGGTVSVASNAIHTGSGALSVNNSLNVSKDYSFGDISLTAAGNLTLGPNAGSIAHLSDVVLGGQINNGSGALTIDSMSNNHGTITALANGGAINFTKSAVNNGAITGGAAKILFASQLTNQAGNITSGNGGVAFNNTLTLSGGSVSASGNDSLAFLGSVVNNVANGIALSGSAKAAVDSLYSGSGTLNLASTSTFYYSGQMNQNIALGTYGNLVTQGSGTTKNASAGFTATNFLNGDSANTHTNVITDFGTSGALTVSGTLDNTNAQLNFGGSNGYAWASAPGAQGGTVSYNGTGAQTIVNGFYYNLLLQGSSTTKNIASGTVTTGSGLTIGSITPTGVTLSVANTGVLVVNGDLTNNESITNNGTITVN